jgi:glutathionylspermidine synthase
MERIRLAPRPDWRKRAEALDFSFHTIDGKPYWVEDAAYRFTADEVDALDDATGELEQMCLALVDRTVQSGAYEPFHLPDEAIQLAEASWKHGHKNLYGRFDLSLPAGQPAKLLEYNADTPTALYEASVVQWEWLQTVQPDADQFNSIHEKLIEAWGAMGLPERVVHFACVRDHAEDRGTVDYLRDTAIQAQLEAPFLHVDEIGWNGADFVDLEDKPIATLFKLYPWEWLVREAFAENVRKSRTLFIEPAWKMLLSTKAILPLLWEMAPGHPNLLPASFDPRAIEGPVAAKPLRGREGANVKLSENGAAGVALAKSDGPYGDEPPVYQAMAKLPEFAGNHAVIGSWVVASRPAGIGIREDDGPITRDTSRFVPHFFA